MYGITEAFPIDLSRRPTWSMRILTSMGRAIPFAEVMVVKRPDGTRAAPGEAGELVHAGPLVAQGYWCDPERTATRFRPAPDFFRASVGWRSIRATAVIAGADGLLRFVGRDDEMIKSGGQPDQPELEIEDAVLAGGEVRRSSRRSAYPDDARLGQAIIVVAR